MPSPRLSPGIARILGLQMIAVPVALVLAWAFVIWQTLPNRMGSDGGIDLITAFVVWTAATIIFGFLGAIHLIFARQLFGESKGTRRGIESW
ncbi:MAG TPA: hypothetical protein VEZ47_05060 [Gemmatirosa sp.]|nr:hypothetical protein [Gemmatirosa sp.]